ncbi:ABC transporter permease [Bacteroidota bacterium]
MIRNYFKIAVRSIIKDKAFSIINIFGLAVSMSVCLLIISMILGLSKYDRFHENYDHIYRVLSKKEKQFNYNASSPMPLRNALVEDYSGVKKVVTFKRGFGGDATFEDTTVPMLGYFCSEEFFEVFSFNLDKGNPEIALHEPFSVVLTKEYARKLFGDEDPLDKVIRFSERGLVLSGIPNKNESTFLGGYTVTGVIDDMPGKTHLEFHILASLSTLPVLEKQGIANSLADNWANIDDSYNYLLLDREHDEAYLQSILGNISDRFDLDAEEDPVVYNAQPLSEITPGTLYGNPFSYRMPLQAIYFMAALAIIVMVSACFNYTNLSLAKSLKRAKEVGIRKVSGAYKYQILGRFIGESIILSIISLTLAIAILQFLKPGLQALWISHILKVDMADDLVVYVIFIAFSIIIGIIAGIIPAFYLSSFNPLKVLKNLSGVKMFRKITLRKALIVVQFSTSLFFIITTTLIYFQLGHMLKAEYGFTKENIINVPLHGNDYSIYANAIKDHSGITGVSGSSIVLTTGGTGSAFLKEIDNPLDSVWASQISVDTSFISNLGLEIVSGENLKDVQFGGTENGFLVNENLVEKLGYSHPHEIIGESFYLQDLNAPLTVRGVVKDFHFSNLISEINPLVMRYRPVDFRFLNAKVSPADIDYTLPFMEEKWKEINKDLAFEPEYMNHQLEEANAVIEDIGYIIGFISILAVSIACLGLLGMVIFITQTKVKEIGIRKVHGASNNDMVLQLSKGFLIMLLIATVVTTPVAKVINDVWLMEFAVRVQFGVGILVIGIFIMLVLGLLTIFSQTVKVAKTNPVQALRYE